MAIFELIATDGHAVQPEKTVSADGFTPVPARQDDTLIADVQEIKAGMAQVMNVLLAQQSEIAKLNRALSLVRVSRTQELALCEAIRARARALRQDEALPETAERRIASAIRTTIRETTGARATGDIQASQFDQVIAMIGSWYMQGALRRIRREARCDGTA